MNKDDVNAVEAEPVETRVQAPAYPVRAEVETPAMGGRHGEAFGVAGVRRRDGFQQSTDLCGQCVIVAGAPAQRFAEASLRQAQPIVGGRVERAHPGRPGGVDGGRSRVVVDRGVQVAQRGGAESEFGDDNPAAIEAAGTQALRTRGWCYFGAADRNGTALVAGHTNSWDCSPRPSMRSPTWSPDRRKGWSGRPRATPAGVPVLMRSPGSSTMY